MKIQNWFMLVVAVLQAGAAGEAFWRKNWHLGWLYLSFAFGSGVLGFTKSN